jgi:hypothetical protein
MSTAQGGSSPRSAGHPLSAAMDIPQYWQAQELLFLAAKVPKQQFLETYMPSTQ